MYVATLVAPLLLAIAACVPHPAARLHQSSTLTPALLTAGLDDTRFDSSDPNPGRFCLVGTKDCMSLSEMSFGTCLLSTGRCKAEARIQPASAESRRLLLESPVAGGANPEIVLPLER